MLRAWGIAVLLCVLGCRDVGLARLHRDAGVDGGVGADAGVPDAGPPDAGTFDGGWIGTWEPLGPPLGSDAQVYPALAFDPRGRLLVAYVDLASSPGATPTELHVVRWSGSTWEPLGGTVARSDTRFPYSAPLWLRLASERDGRPVLAFGDSGPDGGLGSFPVQTWAFDGSAWQPIPAPGSGPFLNGMALACGPDGQLRLVLSGGDALGVWTLGPAGWTPAVAPLLDDGGVSEPDLALAGDGSPVVVFSEAPAPGSFGPLRAWRWDGAGWIDLGLPSPDAWGMLFHTPRVRLRSDGGVVVAASQWRYDPETKMQLGVAEPVFALGEGGWTALPEDGPPGGSGLSEPIAGAPIGLQLANDVPVLVSTGADGGAELRALPDEGSRTAPPLPGVTAGTLALAADGAPYVGGVTPLVISADPSETDGGQVQVLRFVGQPVVAPPRSPDPALHEPMRP